MAIIIYVPIPILFSYILKSNQNLRPFSYLLTLWYRQNAEVDQLTVLRIQSMHVGIATMIN